MGHVRLSLPESPHSLFTWGLGVALPVHVQRDTKPIFVHKSTNAAVANILRDSPPSLSSTVIILFEMRNPRVHWNNSGVTILWLAWSRNIEGPLPLCGLYVSMLQQWHPWF